MPQLENITAIERRLWSSADNLRANSNYASNEYFLPVMGLIFLRHAYSRYLAVRDDIIANLPTRDGKARTLTKEDFSGRGAIYLRETAQFDYLVGLPDSADRAQAIVGAMDAIEADYDSLRGVLPKTEYQELDNDVLGQILRTFNDAALKQATGDIFGRIYEYFLTQFADQKAHDGGEFFTPVSIVQMIVNVIEPDHGLVLDPASGSGGMFVQSAHFIEQFHHNPTERVTFYGMEKNPTTIRLAKMNLAVHGLEGNIQKAITYYDDPHELVGQADFVMANPPFNVDEVDADKIKNDPRLPFGLPGTNKKGKVPNGNYLWISYFYGYLNPTGRAGFVMSSQASSAGRGEAKVRQKLVESGAVDVMVAIRSNFFYTRSVPCELWFLDRAKPAVMQDKVLMIDARNTYRQVTRKIYDFSPEQRANLTAIVWLYRGQRDRFLRLVSGYFDRAVRAAVRAAPFLDALTALFQALDELIRPFLETLPKDSPHAEMALTWEASRTSWQYAAITFDQAAQTAQADWKKTALHTAAEQLAPLMDQAKDLAKLADALARTASRLIAACENDLAARKSELWPTRDVRDAARTMDQARQDAVGQLQDRARYFYLQARWLQERFPDAALRDVPGLVKLVDWAELEENDWSLTPGRYVGVAPEVEDEDFDFGEAMRGIHAELAGLNTEATELAEQIAVNFEKLEV